MTPEHTAALYRAVPGSQPAVVPGVSHLVPPENPALVSRLILDRLAQDAVETTVPVRRTPVPGPRRRT